MLEKILEITNCIIELYIALSFFTQVLNKREKFKVKGTAIILAVLVIHVYRSFLYIPTYPNLLLTAVLFAVVLIFNYKDYWWKKTAALLLYYVAMFFADAVCREIVGIIFNIKNQHSSIMGIARYVGMSLVSIIMYAMLAIIGIIFRMHASKMEVKHRIMMFLFPLFSFFIIVLCDILIVLSGVNDVWFALMLILVMAGLLYFNTAVYEFFDTYGAKLQLESSKKLISAQEENYKLIEINERELRKLKHNLDEQLSIMNTMLENGKETETKDLVESIEKICRVPIHVTYTNDSVLDAVLNVQCRKANELGVKYIVKTHSLREYIKMDAVDKSIVFQNAITNAIEAASKVENGFVVIDIASDEGKLCAVIENSSEKPIFEKGLFKTTKKDKENHGFGIESIEEILKRYDGKMEIFYADCIAKCTICACFDK